MGGLAATDILGTSREMLGKANEISFSGIPSAGRGSGGSDWASPDDSVRSKKLTNANIIITGFFIFISFR
jgi:hypothetical protein